MDALKIILYSRSQNPTPYQKSRLSLYFSYRCFENVFVFITLLLV